MDRQPQPCRALPAMKLSPPPTPSNASASTPISSSPSPQHDGARPPNRTTDRESQTLTHTSLAFVLRLSVASLFLWAGANKLARPLDFADSIAAFQLLPPAVIPSIALALPIFEIIASASLLLKGGLRRAGLLGITGLTLIFLIALASAQSRGLVIDCGCFGDNSAAAFLDATPAISIARNLILLMICGYLLHREYFSLGVPYQL